MRWRITEGRQAGDVREVLDRSNTNPMCPDCDYRTTAIDALRCACTRCGQIVHDETRVVRLLMVAFNGWVTIPITRSRRGAW